MSTPRAKPLEKLITATSKCTLEVSRPPIETGQLKLIQCQGSCIWQMYRRRIPKCPQGYVREGIHAIEKLLSGASFIERSDSED